MVYVSNPREQFLSQRTDIIMAIIRVVERGRYILGEQVEKFEEDFANYLGLRHVIGVASGTDALAMALRAVGVRKGDEVITVRYTAQPTINAIELLNATPVLIGVDDSYTMEVSEFDTAITSRTKAVVPVHLYGLPARMNSLVFSANAANIPVVEDCAQAHGARIGVYKTGTIGKCGCFSFYPTKNLGCFGDGGAVVTDDDTIAATVRNIRENHWTTRLDELQASVLRVKLRKLDEGNLRRRKIAARYYVGLQDTSLILPTEVGSRKHIYHQYVIQTNYQTQLQEALQNRGVQSLIRYPVEPYGGKVLSLPMYPELNNAQIDYVITAIKESLSVIEA